MNIKSACKDKSGALGIKFEEKWRAITNYHHTVDDFYHKNDGPWPQPAPANPVGQMAEVIHLSEDEKKAWKSKVGYMYIWRVLTRWPWGLWYAFTHNRYKEYDDKQFNRELCEGLYSKFLTSLDEGDLELFKDHIPDLDEEADYVKADFSCMEPIAPHCFEGMSAAPTMTLVRKDDSQVDGLKYQVVAIYLYEVEELEEDKYKIIKKTVFQPNDGDPWHLAKYFVLQGAVHRVNLTEHALLHFPYDPINAITKTILPTSHLLFQLLIPHLYLSLGVNKAVLENPGSLINRDKHKFYSPFCAEGKFIRKLLPDGYIGRGEKKENSYPVYSIQDFPKFPDSQYGTYLKAYYQVFEAFVPKVLDQIDDSDKKSWELIALWIDCIEEWMPGFPTSERVVVDGKPVCRECLYQIVTLVMWDLSVAHATDHIAIHNKQPHGNPFRLRVKPPKKNKIDANWHIKLVNRWDLLTFWFTDLLFYLPNNVTLLQEVIYPFKLEGEHKEEKEALLKTENQAFLKALRDCELQLIKDEIHLAAKLEEISTSLQY